MAAQELPQLNSPSDGQDPALQVQNILANLADTGWLEKESDAEGGADNECPDPGSNPPPDVYDFDPECPPEKPISLEAKPSVRRRRSAEPTPAEANHNSAQRKSKQAPTLAQRRRAYILHDEDSHEQQQCQKNTEKTTTKVPSNERHEPSTDAAAARAKDVLETQSIGSLNLQQNLAASQERQSRAKGLDFKAVSRGLGEPNNEDHLPEEAPKHRRKRKRQEHKENVREVTVDEVEDVGGPFPILPDFSAKNLAMLRPDVLLRPPERRPIYRPVPTPESLLLPLPSQHTTQLCAPKKLAAKLQATSQSPMLSLERSDRALAAEAGMNCASRLPPSCEGPASTGTRNKRVQPGACVSRRPAKRQNRQSAPDRQLLPAGTGFLRASDLVPLSSSNDAAGPQSVHGCARVKHVASTEELQGISLAAPASEGVMDVNDGSQRTGSQEQRYSAAMQNQYRNQLGVFADCDSEDEDLALDYNLLEQQLAEAPSTCRHVTTASQCLPAVTSPILTIGGMHSQSITDLPESAAPRTYGPDTCKHASTAVSLREAICGPHPYEALARKAAAQLGDRTVGTSAHAGACRVVFAEEDESGQAMDEHWPRAGHWQQAPEQSALHDKSRQATAAHWPTASGSQLATLQPTSAAVQTAPCRARSSQREPPIVKDADRCGSSRQEQQARRRKDLASFDLLDRFDFGWGDSAPAAQPAHPVASIESGTINPAPRPLDRLKGCQSTGALNQVQWDAHGGRAVEGSRVRAEDWQQCEIVFMDEEASAPAVSTMWERRPTTAVAASCRQMRHEKGTLKVSEGLGIDRWTNSGIPGQVATKGQAANEHSSPCEIVFAHCTD